jgi:hypothetical protein
LEEEEQACLVPTVFLCMMTSLTLVSPSPSNYYWRLSSLSQNTFLQLVNDAQNEMETEAKNM